MKIKENRRTSTKLKENQRKSTEIGEPQRKSLKISEHHFPKNHSGSLWEYPGTSPALKNIISGRKNDRIFSTLFFRLGSSGPLGEAGMNF